MSVGQEICKVLCDRIGNGAIRNRLPSQAELMAEFHVSSGTVKLALERLKQQRVIYGIRGKGTFVVPTLRTGRKTRKNTVFVRLTVELLRHPFYIAFLTALDKLLAKEGLSLEFKVQPMQNLAGCVVIFLESRLSDGERLQIERDPDSLQLIAVNFNLHGHASVLCGNEQGGYAVMEELYKRGHRQIGIIAKDLSVKGCFFEERLNGCCRFAEEHTDLKIAVANMEEQKTEEGVDSMEDALSLLYGKLPGLTAIFAFTDIFAMDILYRTKRPGSVVGYGNSAFCNFQHPALASVDEQPELLAEKTAELILRFRKGEHPEGKHIVPSVLIPRASLEIQP